MRLIETATWQLVQVTTPPPRYAIFSHTWEEEEVLFEDMSNLPKCKEKRGYAKLHGAVALAREAGFEYIWVDNCCIDKSSSAELSEAINSMFTWYRRSTICYVYLSDLYIATENRNPHGMPSRVGHELSRCRWMRRSWTLQELIAPEQVEFYAEDWTHIGNKRDVGLCFHLVGATRVSDWVLRDPDGYQSASVAQKMSWAAERQATREEDVAYSLFGLFDVSLAPLYGEGGESAFRRLQEEIIRRGSDDTILAWSTNKHHPAGSETVVQDNCPVLAPSPKCFLHKKDIIHFLSPWAFDVDHMFLTPWGLQLKVPVIDHGGGSVTAVLSSRYAGDFTAPLGVRLKRVKLEGHAGTHHYQREGTAYASKVEHWSAYNLEQLPSHKIHVIHDSLVLAGKGRGLGKATDFPRVWLRSLSSGLTIAAAWPQMEWRPFERVFRLCVGDLNRPQRRVLVLTDATSKSRGLVVAFTVRHADAQHQMSIVTYVAAKGQGLQAAADEGSGFEAPPESFRPIEDSRLTASPVASSSTKFRKSIIKAEACREMILGEIVDVLDILRA
ncbi:HET domain-containing protein [Microdochium nivale]|nr:HET domain-containing protein [Microdochium nivale]